jgi:hypothetical protein
MKIDSSKLNILKVFFWIVFLGIIANLLFLDILLLKKNDFGLQRNRFSKEFVGKSLNISEIAFREICNVELLSNSRGFMENYRFCCSDLGVQSYFVVNFCFLANIIKGNASWDVCRWEEVECTATRDISGLKLKDLNLDSANLLGLQLMKLSLSNSTFVLNMGDSPCDIQHLELVDSHLNGGAAGIRGLKRISLRNSTAVLGGLCSNCTTDRSIFDCDCFY